MMRLIINPGVNLLIICSIILFSCHPRETGQSDSLILADTLKTLIDKPIHLEFEKIVNNESDLSLSDFVSEIEYIRLETTQDYLIGDNYVQDFLTDSLIVVNENGKPVGLFSREGKYIRKIGKIGRGPGEYDSDTRFRLRRENREICIWNAMRGSIMVFDFEGNLSGEFKPECKPSGFGYAGNGVFVTSQFNTRFPDSILPKFILFNDMGETLNRYYAFSKNPARGGRGFSIMLPSYYEAPGGLIINTYENDSLFKVFPDGEMSPVVTWDMGQLKVPFDILLEYNRYLKEKDRYVTGIEILESESYWLVSYNYRGNFNMALLNKDDHSFKVVSNPDVEPGGVINDIDGGPSFWPGHDVSEGSLFIQILYPSMLKRWYDEGRFDNRTVMYPEKQAQFIDMIKNIELDDNPILMLVKIK